MILLCFMVVILICSLLMVMLKENILATAIIALWLGFFVTLLAQSLDKL